MPDIVVQDIDPRNQYTAGGGLPTVFAYTFPIFALTDIKVYQTPVGQQPDDVLQILTYNVDYTVTNNVAPAVGGTITLTTGAPQGDIITIVRDMPDDRLNNYIDGGLFQATDVNTDFDRCVMMNQQNKLYKSLAGSIGVGYNNAAVITPIVDNVLPLLPANCVWQMNSTHTKIEAILFNSGQGGGGAVLPTVVNHFATFSNTTGTIKDSGFRAPLADGNANDIMITDGAFNTSFTDIINILPRSISGRNLIINGDFQIWQRGAGGTAIMAVGASTVAYTADRWQLSTGPNQASTVTQTAGAISGSYLAKIQRNAGQNGTAGGYSFITSLTRDTCIGLAGNQVTVSFKALAGANYSPAGSQINVIVTTGTGNTDISGLTPFAGAVTQTFAITLTPALASYSFTTTALGATVTQMALTFQPTFVGVAGADDSFTVTDVQVEIGVKVTAFERLSFAAQLQNCLTYYEKSFPYTTAPAQNVGINTGEFLAAQTVAAATPNQLISPILYKVTKRAVNLITTYNPAAANGEVRNETTATDCSNVFVFDSQLKSFYISCTTVGGSAVGNFLGIHWVTESELI